MKNYALKFVGLLSIALAVVLLVPQRAAAEDEEDPPSRVARLSYTHGVVSFQPAGTDDWVSSVVNRPMTTGDKLWSDRDARAEMHLGSASIRLDGDTGFSFLNLTDHVTQIRMTEGTLRIRVRHFDDDEIFEVDTPNLAFSLLRPGVYKISVNEAGDTTIAVVRSGEGEVTGGGSSYAVHAGQVGTFTGTDYLDADVESLGDYNYDDFDRWCADRDNREDRAISSRYVSRDVIGYEDLDDYGGWRPVPDYGTVWFPHTVIVGWAPYRFGHWCWISPWGWTWVDDAPWGFAPFHYGRWIFFRGAWGWVPCPPAPVGMVYVRPVYAPALVAWVGGPHFSLSISVGGGGGVAWFPLGPREVYVPSYPVSRRYVNNVNVTNTTVNNTYVTNVYNTTIVNKTVNVNNNVTYANRNVPGAVTATSHSAFTSAQPVARNLVAVNQREMASVPVTTAATPGVAPAKQGVLGGGAPAAVRPPAVLQNRPVVAKTPPPPAPVPFARQQEAIQANRGRPLASSETRQLQPERAPVTAPVRIAPPATPATPRNLPAARPGQPPQPPKPAVPPTAQPPQPGKPPTPPPSQPPRVYEDRPPAARPPAAQPAPPVKEVAPQIQQKQQQEQERLRQQQDLERQRIEQKQQQERLKQEQRKADERRQQELQRKQQQQLEQLERKHAQQQQQQQQKQQQEQQKQQKQQKQKPEPKPQPKPEPPGR